MFPWGTEYRCRRQGIGSSDCAYRIGCRKPRAWRISWSGESSRIIPKAKHLSPPISSTVPPPRSPSPTRPVTVRVDLRGRAATDAGHETARSPQDEAGFHAVVRARYDLLPKRAGGSEGAFPGPQNPGPGSIRGKMHDAPSTVESQLPDVRHFHQGNHLAGRHAHTVQGTYHFPLHPKAHRPTGAVRTTTVVEYLDMSEAVP